MKKLFFISIISVLTFSCITENENNGLGGYIDDEEYFNEFYSDTIIPTGTIDTEFEVDSLAKDTNFIDFSNRLLDVLDESKLINFSHHFHPEKGCTFVPYTLIEEIEQNFTSNPFESTLLNKDTLVWGMQDGSGFPIQLDIVDYFKSYVYDVDYKNKATEIHINQSLTFSNTQNNILEYFPDAEYIEFYYHGTEKYYGMDWSSLIFYIEKYNDIYYLVAVVHNQWTI